MRHGLSVTSKLRGREWPRGACEARGRVEVRGVYGGKRLFAQRLFSRTKNWCKSSWLKGF